MDTNKLHLLKTYIGTKVEKNDSMAQFDLAKTQKSFEYK